MAELKIKVDTRVSEDCFNSIKKIADEKYDGNFSMAMRIVLKEGVLCILDPSKCMHVFEWIGPAGQTECKKCGTNGWIGP